MHNCTTDNGSFGSPILNLQTNKVIGIHYKSLTNYNIGTLLKLPIKDFINPLASPSAGALHLIIRRLFFDVIIILFFPISSSRNIFSIFLLFCRLS